MKKLINNKDRRKKKCNIKNKNNKNLILLYLILIYFLMALDCFLDWKITMKLLVYLVINNNLSLPTKILYLSVYSPKKIQQLLPNLPHHRKKVKVKVSSISPLTTSHPSRNNRINSTPTTMKMKLIMNSYKKTRIQ